MKSLLEKLDHQLNTLEVFTRSIERNQYTTPVFELGNASVGQHVRHTIEIIQALINGYLGGEINYEQRKRDLEIETAPEYASNLCKDLSHLIDRKDKALRLTDEDSEGFLETSYQREIHFVLEHTIHHMALIKTGLRILRCDCTSDDFGMAYSTIKYRAKSCAQ